MRKLVSVANFGSKLDQIEEKAIKPIMILPKVTEKLKVFTKKERIPNSELEKFHMETTKQISEINSPMRTPSHPIEQVDKHKSGFSFLKPKQV